MSVKVERNPYYGGKGVVLQLYPEGSSRPLITVEKTTQLLDGKWRPVAVNWSAIGSVGLEEASAMADALQGAVALATQLEFEMKTGTVNEWHNQASAIAS